MKATMQTELAKMKSSRFADQDSIKEAEKMFNAILNTPICDQFSYDLYYVNSLAEKHILNR